MEAQTNLKRRDFTKCPTCGNATVPSKAINGLESKDWRECVRCNTYINTYIPLPHQSALHKDATRFLGNFGGFGTGKTTTSQHEVYKHIFLTPYGNTLVGANINPQYEQTIKRDIESNLPAAFVAKTNTQKQYYDLINGHRLMFRPFYDPDNLRSLNLSMFVMIEASEIKGETFHQIKTRLRNTAATIPQTDEEGNILYDIIPETGDQVPKIAYDWRKGIIESNPDSGWIRNEVLLYSGKITHHGNVVDTYHIAEEDKDPNISTHVASSDCNKYLPPNWIDEISKNKPLWWISRFVYGSFKYAEGMVYPSAPNAIVETFDVPKHWKRIVAYDYGLSDNSVFIFGAVDERKGILYIYKEVVTNDKSIEELAALYHENVSDIPSGGMICQPIMDPKSMPKRDYNKKTLGDHFLDYGIYFKPGHISIDARIFRLNTYFESGKIKIMDCCKHSINELKEYKFKAEPDKPSGWSDKPVDKNNHCINAIEWITMELPADPRNLVYGVYNRHGVDLTKASPDPEREYNAYALSDSEPKSKYEEDSIYGEASFYF